MRHDVYVAAHRLPSGFLASDHLPIVSHQSPLSDANNDKDVKMELCFYGQNESKNLTKAHVRGDIK